LGGKPGRDKVLVLGGVESRGGEEGKTSPLKRRFLIFKGQRGVTLWKKTASRPPESGIRKQKTKNCNNTPKQGGVRA